MPAGCRQQGHERRGCLFIAGICLEYFSKARLCLRRVTQRLGESGQVQQEARLQALQAGAHRLGPGLIPIVREILAGVALQRQPAGGRIAAGQSTGREPLVTLRYFGPHTNPDAPTVGDHHK